MHYPGILEIQPHGSPCFDLSGLLVVVRFIRMQDHVNSRIRIASSRTFWRRLQATRANLDIRTATNM